MNCSNCGHINLVGATFCIKCGTKLNSVINHNIINARDNKTIQNNSNLNVQMSSSSQINNDLDVVSNVSQNLQVNLDNQNEFNTNVQNNQINNVIEMVLNYFKYIISFLIKPFSTFQNEENKLAVVKNSLILSGIIAILMMILNLIGSMISSAFAKDFYGDINFDLGNLGDLNYLSLIFKNLLIYIAFITGVALVYYLVGMLFKKKSNYFKLLTISASSLIPFALSMLILPVLNIIWEILSVIVTIITLVYSLIIFVNLMLKEFSFENKDINIYFQSICLVIVITSLYFIMIRVLVSSLGI